MQLYRTTGVLPLDRLDKKILQIGMGSLGSLVAANLAYPFKQLILADPEILEEDNIERHLLGRHHLGSPKAVGVRHYLEDRGVPQELINSIHGDVRDHLDNLTDVDLVIISVDKRVVRDDINSWCVRHNIPTIVGGVYPLGAGGHIMVLPQPNDICYQCGEKLMGGNTYEGHLDTDYGISTQDLINPSNDLVAVPALRWSVNLIASRMADIALELLIRSTPKTLAPQVIVDAFDWEPPVLVIQPGPTLSTLAQFMSAHNDLGLNLTLAMSKVDQGYELKSKRGVFSLILERWENCPLHDSRHLSLEDL